MITREQIIATLSDLIDIECCAESFRLLPEQEGIEVTKHDQSKVLIWWDDQDGSQQGWAIRDESDSDSLDMLYEIESWL